MDSVAKAGLKSIGDLVASTKVLLIDDDYYMRKVIRSLLLAVGIKDVHEAAERRRRSRSHSANRSRHRLLDWEMPQHDRRRIHAHGALAGHSSRCRMFRSSC